MENFSKQQEEKKEVKEKDKVRREKLAGYFFNLSFSICICRTCYWVGNPVDF